MFLKKTIIICIISINCIILINCNSATVKTKKSRTQHKCFHHSIQEERDHIFSLFVMAMTQQDWQTDHKNGRGYNIGAILVDNKGKIINWARNCVNATYNGTQHAEVRLVLKELTKKENKKLTNLTIYSTLEPCIQCAGMLTLQNSKRVVYVQKDPTFGNTFKLLKNYPRKVNASQSCITIAKEIDDAFSETSGNNIVEFLSSDQADKLYKKASIQLKCFSVRNKENREILNNAMEYLNQIQASANVPVITIQAIK